MYEEMLVELSRMRLQQIIELSAIGQNPTKEYNVFVHYVNVTCLLELHGVPTLRR